MPAADPKTLHFHPAALKALGRNLGSAALSLVLLSAAQAQTSAVRKCLIDGKVAFQTAPCAHELRRNAVVERQPVLPAAPIPVDSAGRASKRSLAEVLRARGDAAPRDSQREAQDDGALVLGSRMGAV